MYCISRIFSFLLFAEVLFSAQVRFWVSNQYDVFSVASFELWLYNLSVDASSYFAAELVNTANHWFFLSPQFLGPKTPSFDVFKN